MNASHPKAVEAAEQAAKRAEQRTMSKALIQELHGKGVRWLEVEPSHGLSADTKNRHGRMTIAYFPLGRNVVAVATSLCHPDDYFDKTTGRARAGLALSQGHYILLRRPSSYETNREWLRSKFTEYMA